MNFSISTCSPSPTELKKFIENLSTRRRRIDYLYKQANRYSLWFIKENRIIALLGGIRINRSLEAWYWEIAHETNIAQGILLRQALGHLFKHMSPKSILWYPKLPHSEARILRKLKFEPLKELNMILPLENFKKRTFLLPEAYKIKSWHNRYTGKAAKLNFLCNKETISSLVTISLQTPPGCLENLQRLIKNEKFIGGHTLWHKNQLVGYHLAEKENKLLLLNSLAVHPAHRGKGLGKALFIHTINQFGVKPFSEAGLGVYDRNRAALNIYRKAGFKTRDSSTFYFYALSPDFLRGFNRLEL
ncbi:MAG: GNAT family N-acetyltransferase [Elusimicrobia bacterium]|nr:GNAT family N-acetyltransferase [Elusimicrobiota bacterium]